MIVIYLSQLISHRFNPVNSCSSDRDIWVWPYFRFYRCGLCRLGASYYIKIPWFQPLTQRNLGWDYLSHFDFTAQFRPFLNLFGPWNFLTFSFYRCRWLIYKKKLNFFYIKIAIWGVKSIMYLISHSTLHRSGATVASFDTTLAATLLVQPIREHWRQS